MGFPKAKGGGAIASGLNVPGRYVSKRAGVYSMWRTKKTKKD